MAKKIRYEEPAMPDSLKKLMGIEIESVERRKKSGSKRPSSKKTTKKPGTKKTTKSSNTKQSSAKSPSKNRSTTSSRNTVRKEGASRSSRDDKALRKVQRDNRVEKKTSPTRNPKSQPSSRPKSSKGLNAPKKPKTQVKRRKKSRVNILSVILQGILLFIGFLISPGSKDKKMSEEKRSKLEFSFHRGLSISFIVVVFLILASVVVHKDQKTSVAENRSLEQRPSISISNLVSGRFAQDYTSYLSDQFPFRARFVKAKAKLDRIFGKDEINGVYIGKEGYLMEGFKKASEEATKEKADVINTFVANNPKIDVSVLLSPNKVEVYKNYLPKYAPVDSQVDYLNKLHSMLNTKVKFVDVSGSFDRLKNSEQLFFKTDHHWTAYGAYTAYVDFCKKLNLEPVGINSFTKSLASDNFYGTLYYKTGAQIGSPDSMYLYLPQENPPVIAKYYDTKKKVPSVYDVSKLDTKNPYEVFTGGNHSQIKIRTNVDTDKKLLVVKDSFANAMIPFLVYNFSEITVVDLRYYSGSMKDIISNNEFTDALILGNINTFNSDSSILNLND